MFTHFLVHYIIVSLVIKLQTGSKGVNETDNLLQHIFFIGLNIPPEGTNKSVKTELRCTIRRISVTSYRRFESPLFERPILSLQ